MRIKLSELRRIIKEEVEAVKEAMGDMEENLEQYSAPFTPAFVTDIKGLDLHDLKYQADKAKENGRNEWDAYYIFKTHVPSLQPTHAKKLFDLFYSGKTTEDIKSMIKATENPKYKHSEKVAPEDVFYGDVTHTITDNETGKVIKQWVDRRTYRGD